MKVNVLALALLASFGMNTVQAAPPYQAVANWHAEANKETSDKLVVNPLGNLSFYYAQGESGFSTQSGLFDVTIQGETGTPPTDFRLTSRLLANTLSRSDGSGSTLDVDVQYNGASLTKTSDTTMIDTTIGQLGGNLSSLANGHDTAGPHSAQDDFFFTISGGTTNGTNAVTDFSQLPDGIWQGEVRVQFEATWS